MSRAYVVLALSLVASVARAEPRHAVFVEALGKGGLWGAGYDYTAHRLSAGAVASAYQLGGDRYVTLSPYVAAYPVVAGPHRWFVQLGPQLVRRATPSPVAEWTGMTSTSIAAEASTGYEFRRGLLFRVYAMVSAGDRYVPGLGIALGWSR